MTPAAVMPAGPPSRPAKPEIPGRLSVSLIELARPLPRNPLELCTEDSLFFAGNDFAMIARGVAHAYHLHSGLDDLDRISELLASLRAIPVVTASTSANGPGRSPSSFLPAPPVVMAAMPFDRSAPARLVLPQVLIVMPNLPASETAGLLQPAALGHDEQRDQRRSNHMMRPVAIVATASGDHEALLDRHLQIMLQTGSLDRASRSARKPVFHVADALARERFVDIVKLAIAMIEPATPSPESSGGRSTRHRAPAVDKPVECAPGTAELDDPSRYEKLEKVVLAREVIVTSDQLLSAREIVARLFDLEPHSTVFSIEGFVGASPELLISRHGALVCSNPLAGTLPPDASAVTRPFGSNPDPGRSHVHRLVHAGEALVHHELPAKDVTEHRFVVTAVADALRPLCDDLDVPADPKIMQLHAVSHLATPIRGILKQPGEPSDTADLPSSLELLSRIHPTPAVAGTPRDTALRFIGEMEGFDRGRYAGPVGWMDSNGDGTWVLGIRAATLAGNTARVVAGAGIVAGSQPLDELAETERKLETTLHAIIRTATTMPAKAGADL